MRLILKLNIDKYTLILYVILISAAYLRFMGVDWGFFHPDEGKYVSIVEFFSNGDFNPHFFNYPTFFPYLIGVTSFLLYKIHLIQGSYTDIIIVGRFLSAFFSTLTVYVCYLIGKEVHSEETGLLSAFFFTFSRISIINAHFSTVDSPLTFFFTASVFYMIKNSKEIYNFKYQILTGILIGISMGTKYTAGILIVPLTTIYVFNKSLNISRKLKQLFFVLIIIISTFSLTSPFVLIDSESSIQDISYEMIHVNMGHYGLFPEYSESGWIWYITNGFPWSFGVILAFFFYIGLIYSIIIAIKRNDFKILIIIVTILSYLAYIISWDIKFVRYLLIVLPLCCIVASLFIVEIINRFKENVNVGAKNLALIAILILIVIQPLIFSVSYFNILIEKDIRIEAKEWIESNISSIDEINLGPKPNPPSWMLPPLKNKYVSESSASKTQYVIIALPLAKNIYLRYINENDEYLNEDWFPRQPPTEELLNFYSSILIDNDSKYDVIKTFKKKPHFLIFEVNESSAPYDVSSITHPEIRIYKLRVDTK